MRRLRLQSKLYARGQLSLSCLDRSVQSWLVQLLTTFCAMLRAWERGRPARSGSGQDGRAPRGCTSTSAEMHWVMPPTPRPTACGSTCFVLLLSAVCRRRLVALQTRARPNQAVLRGGGWNSAQRVRAEPQQERARESERQHRVSVREDFALGDSRGARVPYVHGQRERAWWSLAVSSCTRGCGCTLGSNTQALDPDW